MPEFTTRQTSVGLKARLDIHRLDLPALIVASGGYTLSVNRKLTKYFGADQHGAGDVFSFQNLQEHLGTSIREEVERVIADGVSVEIPDIVFTHSAGGGRRANILLSPATIADDHTRCCLVLLIDSTNAWIIEKKQSATKNELAIVSQVSAQLGATMETDEIVKTILIAVTAREGLGFNRAFLMLIDDSRNELRGHHAIGPVDADEAGQIWGSIPDEGKDLKSIISSYIRDIRFDETSSDRAIRDLVLSLNEADNPVTRVASGRTPALIDDAESLHLVQTLSNGLFGASEIAIAPLNAKGSVLGLIVADNMITGRRIQECNIDQLQMFANQAGLAIEGSRLYENLQAKIKELKNVNLELERTHRQIVQIERLSLMGEMTYRITHELRNPLTIIGGFASLLLRSSEIPDSDRERAEIIWTECRRVEQQLDALLDFSKSYSDDEDDIDFSLLLSDVVTMVQSKFTQTKNSLHYRGTETEVPLRVRKDLLMHGMFCLLELLSEIAGPGVDWEVTSVNPTSEIRAEIYVTSSSMSYDESTDLLRRFVEHRASTSDLRLSLANEAIAYDGGELGFEIRENRPIIYVAFSMRENANG